MSTVRLQTTVESYHCIGCFHPLLSAFIVINSANSDETPRLEGGGALIRDLAVCMALLGIFCINALTLVHLILGKVCPMQLMTHVMCQLMKIEHIDCSTIF